MNPEVFSTLKKAFKYQQYDEGKLKQIKTSATPIIAEQIDYITSNVPQTVEFEYQKFQSLRDCPEYKDELVITFLLYIGKQFNFEKLIHTFAKPFTNCIYNWLFLYKTVIYVVISLMYNKKWSVHEILDLDKTMLLLNEGHPESLRQLMGTLQVLSSDKKYEAETNYMDIRKWSSVQYGPFYWKMLHFMAEALELRKNLKLEKGLWKDFTLYQLHRTLRCIFCIEHYNHLVSKHEKSLKDSTNYPNLWFDIHNEVNELLKKMPYSKVDFERDRIIMRKLLS